MAKYMNRTMGDASTNWDGNTLTVSTGKVSRTWNLTEEGLSTVTFENLCTNSNFVLKHSNQCDWDIRGFNDISKKAQLIDVRVKEISKQQLVSDSLVTEVEFEYPHANLGLICRITAYPGAPGIRTQLYLKLLKPVPRHEIPGSLEGSRPERIPIQSDAFSRRAAGYYNDTQHRNTGDTPILKEEVRNGPVGNREIYDWANLLILSSNAEPGGIILVKESHKCVNQPGLDGGAFILKPEAVEITGLGLNNVPWNWYNPESSPAVTSEYRKCWASWAVLFTGDMDQAGLALKVFDRFRFPPQLAKDNKVRANTWGTRFEPGRGAADAAEEENIQNEIKSCADLGIELLTIDAGWDKPLPESSGKEPPRHHPAPERFPGGWKALRDYAKKKRIALGLHFPVNTSLEPLIDNYREGGFSAYKLDFGNYVKYADLHDVLDKAHRLSESSDSNVRISWDLTENMPRVGYYLGREYGTLYPSNRREVHLNRIRHVAYIPRLVFRDAWHFSHYLNLNQIETTIQNPDRMEPEYSNASLYSHSYTAAVTFMAQPLFFLETQFYNEKAREELRPLLKLYKEHRDKILQGYVFPLGDEPDDRSWSGFQCHFADTEEGYITLFRELYNTEEDQQIRLHFLEDRDISFRNLVSGTSWNTKASPAGEAGFSLSKAPSFLFLHYQLD